MTAVGSHASGTATGRPDQTLTVLTTMPVLIPLMHQIYYLVNLGLFTVKLVGLLRMRNGSLPLVEDIMKKKELFLKIAQLNYCRL